MFCTQCHTNWAALWSYDEGDNGYEFCPNCYTDQHLEETREGDQFIACKFTGVINVKTRKRKEEPMQPGNYKEWNPGAKIERYNKRVELEEEALRKFNQTGDYQQYNKDWLHAQTYRDNAGAE